MSTLGNEGARAQVGTNGGLIQRWPHDEAVLREPPYLRNPMPCDINCRRCALDAAKLRIEEAVKALGVQFAYDAAYDRSELFFVDREAVLKIIREIL